MGATLARTDDMVDQDTPVARIVAELVRRGAYAHLRGGWIPVDWLAMDVQPSAPGSAASVIHSLAMRDDSPVQYVNPPDRSAVQLPSNGKDPAIDWIRRHDPAELPQGLR